MVGMVNFLKIARRNSPGISINLCQGAMEDKAPFKGRWKDFRKLEISREKYDFQLFSRYISKIVQVFEGLLKFSRKLPENDENLVKI